MQVEGGKGSAGRRGCKQVKAHQTETTVLVGSRSGMRQKYRLGFRAAAFILLKFRPLQVQVREGTARSDAAGTSTPSPAHGMAAAVSRQACGP